MTYLTRLAAQTGLIASVPDAAATMPSLEVIEEEIVVSTPDSPALPQPDTKFPDTPPARVETQTIVTEAATPTAELPETTLPPIEELSLTPPATPEQAQDDPPEFTPEPPPEDQSPEAQREWQLRQVMSWVASNEAAFPPAAPVPDPTSRPVDPIPDAQAATPPQAESEIPELEIAHPAEATEPPPTAPHSPAPPVAEAPQPQITPAQPNAAPAVPPEVVSETVEISIGAIHLDVTPPPRPARAAPTLTASAPPPAPRAASAPDTSSRLARRYIRI